MIKRHTGGPTHEPVLASSGPGRHARAGRRGRWRSSPTEHRHSKARPPRPLLAPRPLRVGQSGGLRGGVPVSPAPWNRDGDARSQRRSAARRLTGAPWDDRGRRHPVDDLGKRHPPRGNASETSRREDRKSTRLNSSHGYISYAVFCLKKKTKAMSPIVTKHSDYVALTRGPTE